MHIKVLVLSVANGANYHWALPLWRELSNTAFPSGPLFWPRYLKNWLGMLVNICGNSFLSEYEILG